MSGSLGETKPVKLIPAAVAARSELLQSFEKLLRTGQGSDLTITCKGESFKVHSAIIAPRSQFFRAACWGGFKEAENHCIDLPNDDPTDVGTMLEYLYVLDYDSPYTLKAYSDCPDRYTLADIKNIREISTYQLLRNASMYGIGAKYGIDGLKSVASEKFAAVLQQPGTVVEWKFRSTITITAFITAVKRVYGTTPESDKGLRDQVLGHAKQHLKQLLPMEVFKAVLAEVPEFAYQLLVLEAESKVLEEPVAKKRKLGEVTIDDSSGFGD